MVMMMLGPHQHDDQQDAPDAAAAAKQNRNHDDKDSPPRQFRKIQEADVVLLTGQRVNRNASSDAACKCVFDTSRTSRVYTEEFGQVISRRGLSNKVMLL